ncbi:MAG: class I SAM-dependent methyltransferase [Phyllobacterium sp.]
MTSEIDRSVGGVLELGPGTGVFTRALLGRGIPENQLFLIEQNDGFIDTLKARFPDAAILMGDAARIGKVLPAGREIGATISGLPLLSMPTRTVMAVLISSFAQMGERGKFYQFTYGPRCPVPRAVLDRLGLKAVMIGRTMHNMPPASVYRISRRSQMRAFFA